MECQSKSYYIMDLEGAFLDLEGALLHRLPRSEGAMASLAPRSLRPCSIV